VSSKKHPEHYQLSLKKYRPILIIFGTYISGTTGHQMTGQFTTSPNVDADYSAIKLFFITAFSTSLIRQVAPLIRFFCIFFVFPQKT